MQETHLPLVTIELDNGATIEAELYPTVAPNTVNNFISLVKKGFYDGLTFHRVIPGFMVQGDARRVRAWRPAAYQASSPAMASRTTSGTRLASRWRARSTPTLRVRSSSWPAPSPPRRQLRRVRQGDQGL